MHGTDVRTIRPKVAQAPLSAPPPWPERPENGIHTIVVCVEPAPHREKHPAAAAAAVLCLCSSWAHTFKGWMATNGAITIHMVNGVHIVRDMRTRSGSERDGMSAASASARETYSLRKGGGSARSPAVECGECLQYYTYISRYLCQKCQKKRGRKNIFGAHTHTHTHSAKTDACMLYTIIVWSQHVWAHFSGAVNV